VKSRIRNGMRRMRATLVESGIEGAIDDESRRSERTVAVAALHAVDAETLAAIEEHATTCPAVRANWIATAPSRSDRQLGGGTARGAVDEYLQPTVDHKGDRR